MDRYFKVAMSALPTAVGLLYLIGVIYDSSYFGHWGLDSDEFPRSFNDTLVRGIVALLEIGVTKALPSVFITASIFVVVILLLSYLERRGKKNALFDSVSKENNGNKIEENTGNYKVPDWANMLGIVTAILSVLSSGYFFLTLVIALLAFFVSGAGQNSAVMRETKLTELPWTNNSIYDVEINPVGIEIEKQKRRLVTCVPNRCVFLTQHGVESIDRKYIAILKTKIKRNNP